MVFKEEWIVKAQQGDVIAFEWIVNAFKEMAIGYAYSILKDYHDAEDVAQEAFVQAFFKLTTLQVAKAFPSWFRKIIYSQCERHYRKKHLPTVNLTDAYDLHAPEVNPSKIMEQDELKSQILVAMNKLTEKERSVTILFYVSDYNMSEISQFLDLPVSTIKNRLHSSRKKLQKEMLVLVTDMFKSHDTTTKFIERVKNMIFTGYKQTIMVNDEGIIKTWGNQPAETIAENEHIISGSGKILSMTAATGHDSALAVLTDGSVWAWGWNDFRHLGTGIDEDYLAAAKPVHHITDVSAVSTGVAHTLALKSDGSCWAWGKNWYGQLGAAVSSELAESDFPIEIPNLSKIKQVSAGYFHSMALAEDGSVYRWGGYGNSEYSCPITNRVDIPVKMEIPITITAISAGGMHSAMLASDGTVWVCGYNTHRQLGTDGIYNEVVEKPLQVKCLTDIIAISAGGDFTLALKSDGSCWAWGLNDKGQLGNGEIDESRISLDDGKSKPTKVDIPEIVIEMTAGGSHAIARTKDGNLWIWGNNDEGQLGNKNSSIRCVPEKISSAT